MAGDTYYDRSVPPDLERLLVRRGALDWLTDALRSGAKNLALADAQLRRDASARPNGAIQIYVGSTCIFEVRGKKQKASESRYSVAIGTYGRVRGDLAVGDHTEKKLADARPEIESYLARAAAAISDRWLTGESRVHAGLMRRYGLAGTPKDPLVAIDREVVLGHDNDRTRRSVRAELIDARGNILGRVPGELDALVMTESGALGLVELKQHPCDVALAAHQVQYYQDRFEKWFASDKDACSRILKLSEQKVRCKLIPDHPALSKIGSGIALQPIVAIPDQASDWLSRWRHQLEGTLTLGQRQRLQLWRLSSDGEVIASGSAA